MLFATPTVRMTFPTSAGPYSGFGFEPELISAPVLQAIEQGGLTPYIEVTTRPRLHLKKYFPGCLPVGRPSRLLVIRYGGMGDVLWITPALRGLKETYPQLTIAFQVFSKDRDILYGCPYVDEVKTMERPTVNECMAADAVIDFFESVEGNPSSNFKNPIDVACDWAGVTPSSYLPYWKITDTERQWAHAFLSSMGWHPGDRVIGFGMAASSPHRSWIYFDELASLILKAMPDVKILVTGNMPHAVEQVHRMKERAKGDPRIMDAFGATTLRHMVAVLEHASVTLNCDTGVVHALAALQKPQVAIYSTVPHATRTSRYVNITPIQAQVPCAPCFKIGEPCEYGERCMTTLSPLTVYKTLEEVYRGLTIQQ